MRFLLLTPILFLLHFAGTASDNVEMLKIAVLSDIHFLSPRLAVESEALTTFEMTTGRNVSDQLVVLDQVLEELGREKPDMLLISGDITNHGERLSHLIL